MPTDPLERQREHLRRIYSIPVPCPNCGEGNTLAEGHRDHVGPRRYEFDDRFGKAYECRACKAVIVHRVPLIASGTPWYWSIAPGQINPNP